MSADILHIHQYRPDVMVINRIKQLSILAQSICDEDADFIAMLRIQANNGRWMGGEEALRRIAIVLMDKMFQIEAKELGHDQSL